MKIFDLNYRKIVVWFFNFLVLTTPLYFRFVNEELFEFNKMILVYTLTSFIIFFWLLRMIIEKKIIIKKTPLDIPILLFFTSQLVSTIFSIHPRTSLLGYYSRFNGGLLSFISYIALYYALVSNIKKKEVYGLFISTFISGILVSVYGILEHFGHSISCLFAPGVKNFSASCWKQDVQSRVFATFGQPNWLAAYAITILPLSLVLAIKNKHSLRQKIFFLITSTLLFTVLIFTRSRSGMVGFLVGIFVLLIGFLVLIIKNRQKIRYLVNFKIVITITTTILLISAIFGTTLSPSFKEVFVKNKQQKTQTQEIKKNASNRLEIGGTDSGEIRKIVWKGGLKIWQRYPLIGSGVETFAYSYYLDRPREHNDVSEWDFLYNKAHNELINLLATTGIFGLATYLYIFIVFGVLIVKLIFSKNNQDIKIISIAILAGISGLFVSNFFGFSTVTVNVLMFILFGIFIILNQKDKYPDHLSVSKKKQYSTINSADQYLGIVLILIFLFVSLLKIYNYWEADKLFSQGKSLFSSGNFDIGIKKQLKAIELSPKEALYYDNLSDDYAKLAVELAKNRQATAASQIANEAIQASNLTMKYNNRHLNFYKTRSRVFITLSQLDEGFLSYAQKTLNEAMQLSPTDPKLVYTQAIIELSNNNNKKGLDLLQKAVELKPNYEKARWKLADIFEKDEEFDKAIEQLQYILDYISPQDKQVKKKILELQML